MGAQKHEFKCKKQYDEKYGKKVEKETKPETKQETKQETEEEKERKKRAYNSARFFLESADRNYRESNNRISNDNYYEYLRRLIQELTYIIPPLLFLLFRQLEH